MPIAQLIDQKCVACKSGESPLDSGAIAELLAQVPGWNVIEENGVKHLERTFQFKDFAQALAFTNRVGQLAEAEAHHPQIITEWGKVTVKWWTHKIGGLHRNDLIMAAKTSQTYASCQGSQPG